MSNEILVLCEHRRGVLREVSLELLAAARELAVAAGRPVTAVLLEGEGAGLAGALTGAADRVLLMQAPELAEYNAERYLSVLDGLLATRRPWLTLLGHTALGMDLAPECRRDLLDQAVDHERPYDRADRSRSVNEDRVTRIDLRGDAP